MLPIRIRNVSEFSEDGRTHAGGSFRVQPSNTKSRNAERQARFRARHASGRAVGRPRKRAAQPVSATIVSLAWVTEPGISDQEYLERRRAFELAEEDRWWLSLRPRPPLSHFIESSPLRRWYGKQSV
jgi:hypothetical protein